MWRSVCPVKPKGRDSATVISSSLVNTLGRVPLRSADAFGAFTGLRPGSPKYKSRRAILGASAFFVQA